jgi:hypothetical protein
MKSSADLRRDRQVVAQRVPARRLRPEDAALAGPLLQAEGKAVKIEVKNRVQDRIKSMVQKHHIDASIHSWL